MPKMFGFSRRRTKLGRLKGHLGDPSQGGKSPMRLTKRLSHSNDCVKEENVVMTSASGRSEDFNCQCSPDGPDLNKSIVGNFDTWMMLSASGDKPTPRFHHAAAVVGSKMVVVGGESTHGMLDDTMILNLDKLTWAAAAPKIYLSAAGLPLKIPACKGHCLVFSLDGMLLKVPFAPFSLVVPIYKLHTSTGAARTCGTLVSWGRRVLLVGGKTDPSNDKVSVCSFDTETECWSNVDTKGDIPAARSGHTVIRAGTVLILFGGEDAKGKKMNDLHMFDLKSLTWLPLRYTGTGPSPRSNHVAALYGDKVLLVFGGQGKSRILNDLYSLDFETMVWTRMKSRGHHPSPRAGCSGAFYGTKWYIIGGGSKKKRYSETLVFDVSKYEWSVCATSHNSSISTNKGFSLVTMHHKDKMFLVAFGGNKKEPSNQIEILVMIKNEHASSWRSAPDADPSSFEDYLSSTKELASHLSGPPQHFIDSIAENSVASAVEHHVSGRKSLSDSSADPNPLSGSFSLRRQFHNEEECNLVHKIQKSIEDGKFKESDDFPMPSNSSSQVMEQRGNKQETTGHMDIAGILASSEENILTVDSVSSKMPQKQGSAALASEVDHIVALETEGRPVTLTNLSNIYQLYETKIATLTRKNSLLEGKLTAALANQEASEKNLSSIIKSKQDMEMKLSDTVKEVELLKEKLASLELAQEEANSLSNIVHSDNVRLEHDVAFLKAVLDDTQKELHSTRGVLAGERARAFQLQVEVFHLKQRLQSLESRALTPRKPYHM